MENMLHTLQEPYRTIRPSDESLHHVGWKRPSGPMKNYELWLVRNGIKKTSIGSPLRNEAVEPEKVVTLANK